MNIKDEPNFARWIDPATGLHCMIVRNVGMGFLCGYVRLPHSNLRKRLIAYERKRTGTHFTGRLQRKTGYEHSALREIDVHGGLTFSGRLTSAKRQGWWLGFDCGHAGDHIPYFPSLGDGGTYRYFAYVTAEVIGLAAHLANILRKSKG